VSGWKLKALQDALSPAPVGNRQAQADLRE